MLKKLIVLIYLSLNLYSETVQQIETTNRNELVEKNPTNTTKTYPDATGEGTPKNWNEQDWKKHMENNGSLGTGLIGRAQSNTSIQGSDIATSGNPNMINTILRFW